MKRLTIKTISLVLFLAFFADTACYGLATLPASQNPIVKREIEAALQRTQIRYAESEDAIKLLNANNASCLLLSSGKYLVTKEVAENDLKLLRAIIHEDIEAIMQIIAKEDRYKYQAIKESILKYFPPGKDNKLPIDLYVNHTVAGAFEWLSLLENRIIAKSEIPPEEVTFINAITPIAMDNRHNYFTAEFWDPVERGGKIRQALNNGMVFYQTANTLPVPDASSVLKDIVSRDKQRSGNSGYRNISAFPDGRGSYFIDDHGMEGVWNCNIECSQPLSNGRIVRTIDAISKAIGGTGKQGYMMEITFVDDIPAASEGLTVHEGQIGISFLKKMIYVSASFTGKGRNEQERIIKDLIKDRVNDLFVPVSTGAKEPERLDGVQGNSSISIAQIAMVDPQRAKDYLHYKFNYRLETFSRSLQKNGFKASYTPIESELSYKRFLENYKKNNTDIVVLSFYQIRDAEMGLLNGLVKEIRNSNPQALIVLEGPSTNIAKQILALIPDIDILIRGESEQPISDLLSIRQNNAPLTSEQMLALANSIGTGVFMRQGNRIIVSNLHRTSINSNVEMLEPARDLSCMWYTERGCPLNCAFCRKDTGGAQAKRLVSADARISWMLKRLMMEVSPESKIGIEKLREILLEQAHDPSGYISDHPGLVLSKDTFIGKEQVEILVLSENALATRSNMMRFALLTKKFGLQKYFKFKIADTTIMSLIKDRKPDIEYIRALKDMNVYFIGFGTENISDAILKQLGKGQDGEIAGSYGADEVIALNKALLEAGFTPPCVRNNLMFTAPTTRLGDVRQATLLIYLAPFMNSVPNYFGNGWGNNRYDRTRGGAATHLTAVDNILYAREYVFPWEKMDAAKGTDSYYRYGKFYIALDTPEYMVSEEGVKLKYEDPRVLDFAKEFGISSKSTRSGANRDTFYRYVQEDFISRSFTEADIRDAIEGLQDSPSRELQALSFIIGVYRKDLPGNDLHKILFTVKAHMVSLKMLSFLDYKELLQKNEEMPVLLERSGAGDMISKGNAYMVPGSFDPENAMLCFRNAVIIASIVTTFATERPCRLNGSSLEEVVRICKGGELPEKKLERLGEIKELTSRERDLIKEILDRDHKELTALKKEGMVSRISYPDTQIFEYLRHLYATKANDEIFGMIVARMNEKEADFGEAVKELVCEKISIESEEYASYVTAIKEYENIQKYFCKGALLSRLRSRDPETVTMAVQKLLDAAEKEDNGYLLKCLAANLSDLASSRGFLETGVFITTGNVIEKISRCIEPKPDSGVLVLGKSMALVDQNTDNREKARVLTYKLSEGYDMRLTNNLISILSAGDWKNLRIADTKVYLTGTASDEKEFLSAYADKMKFHGNVELFGSWVGKFSELSGRHRLRLISEIKIGLDASKGLPNSRHVMHSAEEFLYALPIVKRLHDDPDIFVLFIARGSEAFYNSWRLLTEKFFGTDKTDTALYTVIARKIEGVNASRDLLYHSIAPLLSKEEYDRKVSENTWARIFAELNTRGIRDGLNAYLKENWDIDDGIGRLKDSGVSVGEMVKYIGGYGLDKEFLRFFTWAKDTREARAFFTRGNGRYTLNEYMDFLSDMCEKYYRPLSKEELEGLRKTLAKLTDADGYLLETQQELIHVTFIMYMSGFTSGNIRKRMQHTIRPVLNIVLEDTGFSRKIKAKKNILIADESSSTSSSMIITELVLRTFSGDVENVTTFNATQRTEEIAKLSHINIIDEIATVGIWASEDINELFQGAFIPTERGAKEFMSYRNLLDHLLGQASKASEEDISIGDKLREQMNRALDEVIREHASLFSEVDLVTTRIYSPQDIKREIIKSVIRKDDPVEALILNNYLFCMNPFEAHFIGRDHLKRVREAARQKFGDLHALSEIRELDRRIRFLDQAVEIEKYVKSAKDRVEDANASLAAFTNEPLKSRVERYLAGSISFDDLKDAFYRLYRPDDRAPYQAKEVSLKDTPAYEEKSLDDEEYAAILLSDLIYAQLHENRTYEIKYDTAKLTPSQIEIIEEYVKLLQARSSDPNSIKLRPFSSAQGSKGSLIAVYCTGKDFKGEGHVDVAISDGELKDYPLRITGMVNIALASSNIPDNLRREDVDKYRPIMSYIKNQYKAILGEELAIPDPPGDILKVIRRIVLGLPKSLRMSTDRIEEFNRLAKQALTAA